MNISAISYYHVINWAVNLLLHLPHECCNKMGWIIAMKNFHSWSLEDKNIDGTDKTT